jgi:hypothetical protein
MSTKAGMKWKENVQKSGFETVRRISIEVVRKQLEKIREIGVKVAGGERSEKWRERSKEKFENWCERG